MIEEIKKLSSDAFKLQKKIYAKEECMKEKTEHLMEKINSDLASIGLTKIEFRDLVWDISGELLCLLAQSIKADRIEIPFENVVDSVESVSSFYPYSRLFIRRKKGLKAEFFYYKKWHSLGNDVFKSHPIISETGDLWANNSRIRDINEDRKVGKFLLSKLRNSVDIEQSSFDKFLEILKKVGPSLNQAYMNDYSRAGSSEEDLYLDDKNFIKIGFDLERFSIRRKDSYSKIHFPLEYFSGPTLETLDLITKFYPLIRKYMEEHLKVRVNLESTLKSFLSILQKENESFKVAQAIHAAK